MAEIAATAPTSSIQSLDLDSMEIESIIAELPVELIEPQDAPLAVSSRTNHWLRGFHGYWMEMLWDRDDPFVNILIAGVISLHVFAGTLAVKTAVTDRREISIQRTGKPPAAVVEDRQAWRRITDRSKRYAAFCKQLRAEDEQR